MCIAMLMPVNVDGLYSRVMPKNCMLMLVTVDGLLYPKLNSVAV